MLSKEPHTKLFIPGPVEVLPEVLDQLSKPQVGHRSAAFMDVYKDLVGKLQTLLYTENRIWLSTSSATGVWEAAVRNCVKKKALACVCGAFSKKWGQVVELNGKEVEVYGVPMGEPNLPEEIDKRLATGEFDAMTIVHNETSSGVMNPMAMAIGRSNRPSCMSDHWVAVARASASADSRRTPSSSPPSASAA